jgi:transketolase
MAEGKTLSTEELQELARQIRRDIIKMLLCAKAGHCGGPLDISDIMVGLYFNVLNIDPERPSWSDRDFLFLSAGHLSTAWYAVLARRGYFSPSELATFRKINSRLQGHPAPLWTHGVPGVEIASGSLGHGLGVAVGCALGLKLDNRPNRVYVLNSDGELQEGSSWEAMMAAAHHKADNLISIVDRNDCQIDGYTRNIMDLEPLAEKWRAFGWFVQEIDGHSFDQLFEAIGKAKNMKGKPSVIIAHTIMGKGVSFMEGDYRWHGVPPNEEQGKRALSELASTKYGDFIEFEWEKVRASVVK